jgi:hypothetical protein
LILDYCFLLYASVWEIGWFAYFVFFVFFSSLSMTVVHNGDVSIDSPIKDHYHREQLCQHIRRYSCISCIGIASSQTLLEFKIIVHDQFIFVWIQ